MNSVHRRSSFCIQPAHPPNIIIVHENETVASPAPENFSIFMPAKERAATKTTKGTMNKNGGAAAGHGQWQQTKTALSSQRSLALATLLYVRKSFKCISCELCRMDSLFRVLILFSFSSWLFHSSVFTLVLERMLAPSPCLRLFFWLQLKYA